MIIYIELLKIDKDKKDIINKNLNNLFNDDNLRHLLNLKNYPEIKKKFNDYVISFNQDEYLIDEVIDCFEFKCEKKIKLDRNYILTKDELIKYIKPLIKGKKASLNFEKFILENFTESNNYVFFEYYPF